MNIDWKTIKRIHFVGLKGVAMTALAVWAKEAGFMVTGSDVVEEFPTDEVLTKAKISVFPDFDPRNLGGRVKPGLVIYTGAHNGKDNPEVVSAMALGIPVLPHGQALGMIMEDKKQISVAGSHGKTTTSAMIATILEVCGQHPSWAIGCGEISGLGLSGRSGRGSVFVAEADEYVTDPTHDATPRFLWQKPDILIVTNIDFDHPDAYRTLADVQDAFVALQKKQRGMSVTIVNADDPASSVMLNSVQHLGEIPKQVRDDNKSVVTYGFSPSADIQITHVHFGDGLTFFTLSERGVVVGKFTLKVPGKHNVLNATAALIAGKQLGLSWEDMKKGLAAFMGTKRRFEFIGLLGDCKVYDDYAHHPKEIMATIAAAREWFPTHRIIVVFQPHTYSRTKALLSEFAHAFSGAHDVLLTDIYASARESGNAGISGQTLVEETAKHHPNVFWVPGFHDVAKFLDNRKQPGDIIIFMGAGSIYGWSKKLVASRK